MPSIGGCVASTDMYFAIVSGSDVCENPNFMITTDPNISEHQDLFALDFYYLDKLYESEFVMELWLFDETHGGEKLWSGNISQDHNNCLII